MIILKDNYNPNIAIHAGQTLKGILSSLEMSQTELAARTGLSEKTINEIIKGKSSISTETAIKFSLVFGMSATFWNNLETKYKETGARLSAEKKLSNELGLLKSFVCYKELANWGYVKNTRIEDERLINLLNFFGVTSLNRIPQVISVAYRKTKQQNLSRESLAAWLRCGEIDAQSIATEKYDERKLRGLINEARSLTRESPASSSKKLIELCATCGIALVFSPYFKNTFVNGATRWLSQDKALIQISLRGKYSDICWFTFFHELAHILYDNKKECFVDLDEREKDSQEKKADEFASNALIPNSEFKAFVRSGDFSNRAIINFANKIGVSRGIVAGRLSKELNAWKRFSHFRKRVKLSTEK